MIASECWAYKTSTKATDFNMPPCVCVCGFIDLCLQALVMITTFISICSNHRHYSVFKSHKTSTSYVANVFTFARQQHFFKLVFFDFSQFHQSQWRKKRTMKAKKVESSRFQMKNANKIKTSRMKFIRFISICLTFSNDFF